MTSTMWDTAGIDADLGQISADVAAEQRPAAAGSALAAARRRRDEAVNKKHLDLVVPDLEGLDGERFFVRFRPVEFAESVRVARRHEKSKADDKDLVINATILSLCCVGVGLVREDGTKRSVDPADGEAKGDWPRFDARLAVLLDVEAHGALQVIKALYDRDGHILAAGARLTEWSGFAIGEVEEALAGG